MSVIGLQVLLPGRDRRVLHWICSAAASTQVPRLSPSVATHTSQFEIAAARRLQSSRAWRFGENPHKQRSRHSSAITAPTYSGRTEPRCLPKCRRATISPRDRTSEGERRRRDGDAPSEPSCQKHSTKYGAVLLTTRQWRPAYRLTLTSSAHTSGLTSM